MNAAALADVPGSRSMGAILHATPAVYLQRFDVGGTGGPSSIYGAYGTFGFNRPLVEGISISGINPLGVPLDYGAFEHVSVGTGAFGPEWPSPGVQMQITTQSGGNRHRGSVYADVEPRTWQSFNVDADQIARGAAGSDAVPAREANRTWSYHDINADAGGFLRRNFVWWYASARDQHHEVRVVTFPVVPLQTRLLSYTGKLTGQAARNHRLIAFIQGGQTDQPTRLDPFGQGGLTGASAVHTSVGSTANSRSWGGVWKGEWNASFADQLFVEVRAGQFLATRRERPNGGGPRAEDVIQLDVTGGGRDWQTGVQRDQMFASLSYSPGGPSGRHFVKAGGEVSRTLNADEWRAGYPGDVLHVFRNREPVEVYLLQTPTQSENGGWWYGAYVSDTWRLPRTTVMAGVRFDRHRLFLPEQAHPAGRFTPEPQAFPAVDNLGTWNVLAPRLSVVFDATGDGKTLVKASASRYWLPPADLAANSNPNPSLWWQRHAWSDPNGSGQWEDGESGRLVAARGGAAESLAPGLKLPYVLEYTAFVEHELWRGVAVRTGLVWRGERRQFQRVNDNQPPDAFVVPGIVPDPGPDLRPGTGDDGLPIQVWQLDPAFLELPIRNVVQNAAYSASDYLTWEAGATVRGRQRWSLSGGVVHTWNREHASAFLGQAIRQHRFARVPNDFINTDDDGRQVYRIWSVKVAAMYVGPWDLRVSPLLRHQSGQPFGRTLVVALNYAANVPILTEPIGSRRMDNITIFDLRIEKGFAISQAVRLAGFFDVFNVFNANSAQNISWASGTFLQPLNIVSPRIARIGFRVAW